MSDAVQKPSDTPKEEPVHAEANPQEKDDNTNTTAEAKTPAGGERKPRPPRPGNENDKSTPENEIMVAAKGQIKNYLGYAFRILNKTDHRKLTIRATGNAIVKALILIELVKRKVGEIYNYDLHQQNKIYSMEIISQEESKVPGMGQIESKRRVTAMDTILSKDMLDDKDPGYQFCKPEPKQEGTPPGNTQKKEPNYKKKGQAKGPKTYNDEGGKQRRDENKDKHEQDNQKSKKDKKKGNNTENDETPAPQNNAKRGGKNQKSRRENLRNIINDDEVYPRPETRGGRGARGGDRGGKRGGRFNADPRDEYNQGPPSMHHDTRYERTRQDRYQGPQSRSIDRYEANRRGNGGRRVPPPEFRDPRGPPPMPMRGGPQGQGYYQQRGYNQDYYDDYDHGYSNYYGGPQMDRQRGGFGGMGPPIRYNEQGQYPQYREPGRPQRGGGPPRGSARGGPHLREMRGPPQDMHDFEGGPPLRGHRGGAQGPGMRGGPQRIRGGHPADMQPRDHSPDGDHLPPRMRGGRGRGGPPRGGNEDFRGGFRGGAESFRGDRGGRGGRGAPSDRGVFRGGRGGRNEPGQEEEPTKVHKRSRGGHPDASK